MLAGARWRAFDRCGRRGTAEFAEKPLTSRVLRRDRSLFASLLFFFFLSLALILWFFLSLQSFDSLACRFFFGSVETVLKLRSDHSHNGRKPWVNQGDLS